MMNTKEQYYRLRWIVKGLITKNGGRDFWGVLKNEARDPTIS